MDKYDKAVEFYTANPHLIKKHWNMPQIANEHAVLFYRFGKGEYGWYTDDDVAGCGCLTQICSDPDRYSAYNKELHDRVVADTSLPKHGRDIKIEHLPRFAYWRRELDKAVTADE